MFLCTSPLLTVHANINGLNDCNAFLTACGKSTVECVEFLLTSSKLKIKANIHYKNESQHDGFFEACRKGKLDIVRYLLTSPDLPRLKNKNEACLIWACSNDHTDVMQFLCFSPEISEHINLELHKERLLYGAVSSGALKSLQFLKQKCKGKFEFSYTSYGGTVFTEACGRGNINVINFLLYELNYPVTTEEKITVVNYSSSIGLVGLVEKRDSYFKMLKSIKNKDKNIKINKI